MAVGGRSWVGRADVGADSTFGAVEVEFVGAGVSGAGVSMAGVLISFGGQAWLTMIWAS